MTKSKIVRYAANTALLAVMAAAGIGAYQLGTSIPEETTDEKYPSYYDERITTEIVPESMVDADTDQVEAEIEEKTDLSGIKTEQMEETSSGNTSDEPESASSRISEIDESGDTVSASVGGERVSALKFSEDTLMEWPVNGSILLDYNMDQTIYYPTLDQYKMSPSIAVQAEEGDPVHASAAGTVYAIEENAQTGTTVTMELGSGYQAIYGQLKDLTVQKGDTVEEGTVIGYIAAPTKYYSKEGCNLYFAMKQNGEPIDPIAYLP